MKVEIGPIPEDDSERKVKIKIHKYDTWNMDDTLAIIILPMLKQLKETKHGSPLVDIEDVPEELQLHGYSQHEHVQYDLFPSDEHDTMVYDALHARWEWIMDEMIFAFECLAGELHDWEDQFWSGESDMHFEDFEDGTLELKYGPNHTREWDREGYIKWGKRMENGFRLFGKYYRGLWD